MLKFCHGCLDKGFNPFEGNGTTRFLGQSLNDDVIFLVNWFGFYPNANEVSSPELPKPRSTQMTCFVYANHSGCCEVTCWSDSKWNISLLILLKSSLCELVNVWNKLVVCGKLKRMNSCFYQNILLPLLLKTDPTYALDQNKADLFPWVDLSSWYGLCCFGYNDICFIFWQRILNRFWYLLTLSNMTDWRLYLIDYLRLMSQGFHVVAWTDCCPDAEELLNSGMPTYFVDADDAGWRRPEDHTCVWYCIICQQSTNFVLLLQDRLQLRLWPAVKLLFWELLLKWLKV